MPATATCKSENTILMVKYFRIPTNKQPKKNERIPKFIHIHAYTYCQMATLKLDIQADV